jgi:hypothetical protein
MTARCGCAEICSDVFRFLHARGLTVDVLSHRVTRDTDLSDHHRASHTREARLHKVRHRHALASRGVLPPDLNDGESANVWVGEPDHRSTGGENFRCAILLRSCRWAPGT